MVRAVARYCRYRDLSEVTEGHLQTVLAPKDPGTAGSTWKDTIAVMVELKLVERRDDTIVVGSELKGDLADDDLDVFRRALRLTTFADDSNSSLWETDGGRWSSAGAREFSRIAAWFLERPLGSEARIYDEARREVTGDSKLVENEEQLRVFVRWASALGLGVMLLGRPLPDPTVAVRQELAQAFGGEKRLPALALRDRLVAAIPVLRGGSYAAGMTPFLVDASPRPPDSAGPGLRIALRRLERAGVVKMSTASDARPLVLERADGKNPSHVTLTQQ